MGGWLHEIKHDGFRVIARKDGKKVRSYSRPGNDLTYRFPLIVESLARPRSRSCVIDGEAVACDESGVPSAPAIEDGHHSRKHGCCDHGVAFARQMDKAANPSFRRGRLLEMSSIICSQNLPAPQTFRAEGRT